MFTLCWMVSAVEKNKEWKGIGSARGILNREGGSGKAWWEGDFSHRYEGGEGASICLGVGGGLAAGRRASANALMMRGCACCTPGPTRSHASTGGEQRGWGCQRSTGSVTPWCLVGQFKSLCFFSEMGSQWCAFLSFSFLPSLPHFIPFFFNLTRFLLHKIFLSLPFLRSFLCLSQGAPNNETFS